MSNEVTTMVLHADSEPVQTQAMQHSYVDLQARAVAESSRAMVESRYVMALRRPRDIDVFRSNILKECKRAGFASSAIYAKPIGGGKRAEGFSIRFAEAALRCYGNADVSVENIYDDDKKRITRILVTDLENNVTIHRDLITLKQVERRNPRDGQVVISERKNSQGQRTFLVEASEDELLQKESALISKIMRQNILRLIPGDIQEECRWQIQATLKDENTKDPSAPRRRIVDSFDYYGIRPDHLATYLGHPIAQATADELRELAALYSAIREGETSWAEAIADRSGGERGPAPEKQEPLIKERKKKAIDAYNGFVSMLTQSKVDDVVGKPRTGLLSIEDYETAVVALERAQAVQTGAIVDQPPPPRTDKPDLRSVEPQTEDEPEPVAEAKPTPVQSPKVDLLRELIVAAKKAGKSPVEVSREKFSKLPDKLSDDEKRELIAELKGGST